MFTTLQRKNCDISPEKEQRISQTQHNSGKTQNTEEE